LRPDIEVRFIIGYAENTLVSRVRLDSDVFVMTSAREKC